MQRIYLKQAVFFLLLLAAIAGISGCKESSLQYTTITKNDIMAMIDDVEKATRAKDSDGVIKYMAPFVIINVSMETPAGMQRIQMSRDQYKELLQKVFSKASRHDYRHENDRITISDDGRSAIVETDIIEYIVMEGKETRTTTHEKTVIEIIDGKLLVTYLDAVVVNL
ncbi:MAG: hypothetical protein AB1480_10155 [Nitrospirota bacterium]